MIKGFHQIITFFLLTIFLFNPHLALRESTREEDSLFTTLCAPVYGGRGIGTEGNRLAELLLAERLHQCGLVPLPGYTDYLIPFKQSIAGHLDTLLIAVMEDGSREELVYGRDYLFAGAGAAISGTFPVTRNINEVDPSAILFFDRTNEGHLPSTNGFVTMGYPVDELKFDCIGIHDRGISFVPPTPPLIQILRPVYNRISEAISLEARYIFLRTELTLHNAVGVLPGEDRTKAIILSAHFDGVGDQAGIRLPCALDNASGVAILDEVMCQMTGTEPPYDVIFAFTNAEEAGLTGASDLAMRLPRLYDSLYNINVDCVGLDEAPFSMNSNNTHYPALYEILEIYLRRSGFSIVRESSVAGDHDAFEYEGIPSVVLCNEIGIIMKTIHTNKDTVDKINPALLTKTAGMLRALIVENPYIHSSILGKNKHDDHEAETDETDVPALAYHEVMLLDDILYQGSVRWMTLDETLRYHPSLPVPEHYKDCLIQACMVRLTIPNTLQLESGVIVALPSNPQNVSSISALYSDGVVSYILRFITSKITDNYKRLPIGEESFILTVKESGMINGIGLERRGNTPSDTRTFYLFEGNASDEPFEIEPNIFVNGLIDETSLVTKENAQALLEDPDLTRIFEVLIDFTGP